MKMCVNYSNFDTSEILSDLIKLFNIKLSSKNKKLIFQHHARLIKYEKFIQHQS